MRTTPIFLRTSKLLLIPVFILALFASCSEGSSKDDQFCKCMKAGDAVSKYNSQLFDRPVTQEDADKMKSLKERRDKECISYQTMSGEEMLKKKKACTKK